MSKLGLVMMAALSLSACAVHSQGPVRPVAYDFSDHGHYDRQFGSSPESPEGSAEPVRLQSTQAPAAPIASAPPAGQGERATLELPCTAEAEAITCSFPPTADVTIEYETP